MWRFSNEISVNLVYWWYTETVLCLGHRFQWVERVASKHFHVHCIVNYQVVSWEWPCLCTMSSFTDRLFVNKSTVHLHSYVPNLSTHHSYVPNLLKIMSAVWNYPKRYRMRQTQQKNLKSAMHKWVITLTPYILCKTTCYITGVMWLFGLPSQTSRHHNVVITFVVYTVCTHTVIRTSTERNAVRPGYDQV